MKLNTWTSGERGRSLALATALGISQPTVSDWSTGKKGVPVERCVAIERATLGAVTRQDLRPDDWQSIWPELAAAPAPSAQEAIDSVAAEQASADAVRAGVVRREAHRRRNDVTLDVDRRHSGPPFQANETGLA